MIVYGQERDYIIHDENNIKGFFGEYRWLSNFEVCDVYFDGDLYASTEAAYMSGKTLDPEIRKQFQKSSGILPKEARKLGQLIPVRNDWADVRYDTMAVVIFDKFYRNKELREKLLNTDGKYLEETNHWGDVYWGVCNGKGESNLGKILMSVREFWNTKDRGKDKITKLF
jgi:N-glycosidase YbiA